MIALTAVVVFVLGVLAGMSLPTRNQPDHHDRPKVMHPRTVPSSRRVLRATRRI